MHKLTQGIFHADSSDRLGFAFCEARLSGLSILVQAVTALSSYENSRVGELYRRILIRFVLVFKPLPIILAFILEAEKTTLNEKRRNNLYIAG